ncbi:MAG: translation initiation factor IF-2 [Patescibacteria group bacterium]|nr:translation initiation factor IF-2 [Patescibacteria group bacterium]
MATKLTDLAKQLELSTKELKDKIRKLGFDVGPKAKTIDNDLAELLLDELKPEEEGEADTAEIYGEIVDEQIQREIVKKQRKRTAGKDAVKKEKVDEPVEEKAPQDVVEIADVISVKELAEKSGVKIAKIIGELMKNGILANINQQIDFETAVLILEDMGVKLKKIRGAANVEDIVAGNLEALLKEDDPEESVKRPPVVCVMGHVDHGKTKILDYIRSANVIDTEAGGITQHIAAYQVEKNGRKITFLDTPGHEAFTAMRARGAKVTDVAILVVAADEGVKPQTIEAMDHAKEAGVPIVVAINKIDKPNANVDKVKGELAQYDLQPDDWGGKTVMVPVSAHTGEGIDQLLEMILLTADMEDLKADPKREAVGTVIEAHLDTNFGPVATILVNTGTLSAMDNVCIGSAYGRLKVVRDHTGKNVKQAGPSTPLLIAGLSETPIAGDILQVCKTEKEARLQALNVSTIRKAGKGRASSMDRIISQINAGELNTLKIILKADTKGSLEAIRDSLAKIKSDTVAVKVIHSGVGNVTESDVMMAAASRGLVIGFHVDVPAQVKRTAQREKTDIVIYKIIYELLDNITKLLTGMLEPEIVEVVVGRAEVKQVFLTKKKEMIVGCKVKSGKMSNRVKIRVFRDEKVVGEGEIISLQKGQEIAKEVMEGNDCGIKYQGNVQMQEGDIVEAYKTEEHERTLSSTDDE